MLYVFAGFASSSSASNQRYLRWRRRTSIAFCSRGVGWIPRSSKPGRSGNVMSVMWNFKKWKGKKEWELTEWIALTPNAIFNMQKRSIVYSHLRLPFFFSKHILAWISSTRNILIRLKTNFYTWQLFRDSTAVLMLLIKGYFP